MSEKLTLENPEYYKMLTVTRSAVQKNLGKAYLAAIVLMLIKGAVNYFCARPLSFAAASTMPGASLIVLYVFVLIVLQFVTGLLTYGMIKVCTDMILNRAAYVKTVLFGFNRKDAWKLSAFTTLLYFISIAVTVGISIPVILYIFKRYGLSFSSGHVFSFTVLAVTALLFIINIAVNLPFMFAVNIALENDGISLKESLRRSFEFLKGRMIHFAGFAVYSVIKNAGIICACIFVTLALPAVASLLEFIVIIEVLSIVLKLYFSVPVYYYSLLAVNGLLKKDNPDSRDTE